MLWELLKMALGSERTVTKKEISCQMRDLHLQNAKTLHLVPPLSTGSDPEMCPGN